MILTLFSYLTLDVDECTTGNDDCDSTFAYCINTEGSFECACNRGYHGDGYNCTGKQKLASLKYTLKGYFGSLN